MIKFSRVDDVYFFDETMSIPGVRDGYIQRAAEGDPDFVTIKDDDGFEGVFLKGDDGRLIGVGPAIQLATGPATTATDATEEKPLRIDIVGVGQPTPPEEVAGEQPSALDEFLAQGGMTLPADAETMSPAQMGKIVVDGMAGIARGGVKSTLGFGGDVEQLFEFIGRFATDRQGGGFMDRISRAAAAFESPTLLPTSEDIERSKILPPVIPSGVTTDRAMREKAAAGGELAGGLVADPFLAAKGIRAGVGAVKSMAQEVMTTAPVGAITLKGKPQSADEALSNTKAYQDTISQSFGEENTKIVSDNIRLYADQGLKPAAIIKNLEADVGSKLTKEQSALVKEYVNSQKALKKELVTPTNPRELSFEQMLNQKMRVEPTDSTLAQSFNSSLARLPGLSVEQKRELALSSNQTLAPYLGVNVKGQTNKLLTSNGKLKKTETGVPGGEPIKLPDGRGIENAGLALAPALKVGKYNTCPNHRSCVKECLGKTANGYYIFGGGADLDAMGPSRLRGFRMTMGMLHEPEAFAIKLSNEITSLKEKAAKNGNVLAVRLNVLSDVNPKIHETLIKQHPDVIFYDYTKMKYRPIAPNHHYTYSSTGLFQKAGQNGLGVDVDNPYSNWAQMRQWLDGGQNVAMAFSNKKALPQSVRDEETGKIYKVIDGDSYDYRPMDAQPPGFDGVIIGLKNKAITRKEAEAAIKSDGFFVQYDPKFQKDETGKRFLRGPSPGVSEKSGKPLRGPLIPTNTEVVIAKQQTKQDKMIPISSGQPQENLINTGQSIQEQMK